MESYKLLLRDVLENGVKKSDRTGTGTRSVFGRSMRVDLSKGFPLLTTKKVHFKSIVHELLWFLSGSTNTKYLEDNGVTIWNEWKDANGDLGRVYGSQWRTWVSPDGSIVDQITRSIEGIKQDPDSRRHLVSAWNPGELDKMALPPCHYAFQFYVADGKLSCMFQMRSVDTFLGLPFNLASYGLLTHMFAQQCDLEVGELIWSGGDVHIYENHIEQVQRQLERDPKELPTLLILNKPVNVFSYQFDDFQVAGYDPHPGIKAPISI